MVRPARAPLSETPLSEASLGNAWCFGPELCQRRRSGAKRLGSRPEPDHVLPVSDTWKEGIADCTAKLATPICQIPPTAKMVKAGFNKFKTANPSEAYKHFTGRELENAHSAMADVMACRDVYFAIQDLKGEAA